MTFVSLRIQFLLHVKQTRLALVEVSFVDVVVIVIPLALATESIFNAAVDGCDRLGLVIDNN